MQFLFVENFLALGLVLLLLALYSFIHCFHCVLEQEELLSTLKMKYSKSIIVLLMSG